MVERPSPRNFFTEAEKQTLVKAIRNVESQTSGEICAYLEHKAKQEPMKRARAVFEKLGMTRTQNRNGVLFYFSLVNHEFVVLGDRGIHEKVDASFWERVVAAVQRSLREGKPQEGLLWGIEEVGEELKRHFPRRSDDVNELEDRIRE